MATSNEFSKMKPKLNILIYVLDDHQHTLEHIDKTFQHHGIKDYQLFSDADNFIKALNEDVHLVVIDYWLKGQATGLQVCKQLYRSNPQCFVIVMSNQADLEVVVDFMNAGADKYVMKQDPDWLTKLVSFVREGIGVVQKNLEWYYELFELSQRQKDTTNA